MTSPSTITIDGTAAAGKSTVAERLAQSMGYLYFDTGIMYRAVTWAVLDRGLDLTDVEAISALAEEMVIEVIQDGPDDGRQNTVLVDKQDITWELRTPDVDANVSSISSHPRVRTALTNQQRRIAATGSIVMVGRDIGTVVLPEADLKIFMVASPEERARRRHRDALNRGRLDSYKDILAAILARDELDRNNPVSPMVPAKDAIVIETDNLSIEEVQQVIEQLIAQTSKA